MRPTRTHWTAALVATLALAAVPAAATDFSVHGLLDVATADRGEAFELNRTTFGNSPFDAFGLRLFADAAAGEKVTVSAELLLDDNRGAQVVGAYVRYRPRPLVDFDLIAGKIPWPIGTFGSRSTSSANPLIGRPLMYQHHTTLLWYMVPPNADALLAVAGSGQSGVNYFGGPGGGVGMPIVDDAFWDVGVIASGSHGPFEGAVGMVNGAPGWASTVEDDNGGKSVLGRLGFSPVPAIRVGISGSHGPYLHDAAGDGLPPGKSVSSLPQDLVMADLELLRGHAECRAEGFVNRWATGTVGDLRVTGYYVEGKYALIAGLYGAARWDQMRFSDLLGTDGLARPWDRDVDRIEAGLGFRPERGLLIKGVYQREWLRGDALHAGDAYNLIGGQLSVSF